MDASTLLNFNGTIGSLAYTVPFIELDGFIEYESVPSNGHTYYEQITFQKVFVRHAEFSLERLYTSLNFTEGSLLVDGEEAVFVATITNVINFGHSADLTLVVEVNDTYLSMVMNSTKINFTR